MSIEYKIEKVISFFLCLLILPFVQQMVHASQVLDFVTERPIYKVPYSVFKREFENTDFIFNETWPSSLFSKPFGNSEFHAGIIKINGKGYILTTYGYVRALFLKARKISQLRGNASGAYRYKMS